MLILETLYRRVTVANFERKYCFFLIKFQCTTAGGLRDDILKNLTVVAFFKSFT